MSGTSSFLGSFMNRYDKAHLRVLFELAKGSNEYFEANESFYRDHFVHAIDVFLLGNYFILKDKKLRDESRKMVEATAWAYNLPYTWMLLWGLTALFHDLAYLFQKIRSILPIRAEIDTATDPELAFWDEFLKSLSVREREFVGSKMAELDHGVLSGMWLLKEVRRHYYDSDDERKMLFSKRFFPVGRAICLHNVDNQHPNVSFDISDNFLGFLLVLCDELHEQDRIQGKFYSCDMIVDETLLESNEIDVELVYHDDLEANDFRNMCVRKFDKLQRLRGHKASIKLTAEKLCKSETITLL